MRLLALRCKAAVTWFISICFSSARKEIMGLCIALQSESGEQTLLIADERNLLGQMLEKLEMQEFPMLSSIDIYEDTIFNRLQIKRLLTELEVLLKRNPTSDERLLLQAVSNIGEKAQEDVHQYIVFIGD